VSLHKAAQQKKAEGKRSISKIKAPEKNRAGKAGGKP